MADDKYSIDDILKEVDTIRGPEKEKKRSYSGSVTDIIGGNEIDKLLRAGAQKKPSDFLDDYEDAGEEGLAGKQKNSDISVTQVIESIAEKRKNALSARQLTDEEVDERRNADISAAFEKKQAKKSRGNVILPARQRTDTEVNERIAKEISEASDIRKWANLTEDGASENNVFETGDFGEEFNIENTHEVVQPESEYVKPYVKPDVSGADDDIIFHTRGDLVTTDTMQLRKQQRIEEINQALLKVDSEADSPDDMLASLNPMESRAKATEQLKSEIGEDTDTLAVSGNDLKRIGKNEENIKEYRPSASRKKTADSRADEVLFSAAGAQRSAFPGGLHVGESIVEALNKKIDEENRQSNSEKTESASSDDTQSGKINIIASASDDEIIEEEDPAEKIRLANELAQKKKRRISEFILESSGSDTEEIEKINEDYEDEDEDEETIDLDDENVIRDRLARASKGLVSRLIILLILFGITVFIAVINVFRLRLGNIGNIVSYRSSPDNYLYAHLTIGILSFAACSSVISNGFSRLIKLRPDGDTLCALAHVSALAAAIPYLAAGEYIQRGRSQMYLMVSLAALCFNTLSKLCTVKTAQKNLAFTSGAKTKYFVEQCSGDGAEQLAKGAVMGMPVIASMRKTEMLCDFIVSTYCEDISDRVSRKVVPASIIAALVGGLAAFFTGESTTVMNNVCWGATVCSAIFSLSAAFSSSMTVTLPLLSAARKTARRGSAILGYGAAEEFSETNAVLVEAKTLFPANSVKINNICGYDKPKNRCEGKINIDEAIIYAASLAVASDSVLADAFFSMLNYKHELLKPVSGCVYENNLGVMGWIDRRRVLLGNRRHMKSHEITVPNTKKEAAANVNNDEVIYLAVGGEVCLLFFVQLTANSAVKHSVQSLAYKDISLVIKTVDGMVTSSAITGLFEIDEENVKILPFEAHELFNEHTKFVSSGKAAVSCSGNFSSFASSIITSKTICGKAVLGSILQISGIALGILLAIIFALFKNYNLFNMFFILFYNLGWAAITLGSQFFKRS